MFLLECGKKHTINYNESCCLKHLLEMNNHADMSTLTHKYAKLLLKTLNHYFKLNQLSFVNLKLEEAKTFLDIMSRYISHYYFLNKFEFAKLLVKMALKTCDETLFKEHPELIIRRCAIYNNLACVYERTGSYTKSIKYLKYYLKFANNILDKAVVYNNMGKIFLKISDKSSAMQAMKSCYDSLKDEIKTVMNERLFKLPSNLKDNNQSLNINYQNKIQLISFLYFNYASFLTHVNKEKESIEIFRKGYEFSVSNLSDYNSIVSKFSAKIGNKIAIIYKSPHTDDKRITIDSKYDSDLDYMSIMDNNFSYKSNKMRNYSEDKQGYPKNIQIDKKTTLNSLKNGNNLISPNSFEMFELKNKMDILLQKFDKIDLDKFEKLMITRKESLNNSKKAEENQILKPINNSQKNNSEKKRDSVNDIMKKLIEPGAKKFFIKGQAGPVGLTEDVLKEIMSEVEMEQMFNISGSTHNRRDSLAQPESRLRSRNGRHSLFLNKTEGNLNIHDKSSDSKLNNSMSAAPKKNLRDLFRKFIPTERLEAIDAIGQKQENKGIFTELISSMIDDDSSLNINVNPGNPNSNIDYKKNKPTKKANEEVKIDLKKSTTLFNEIMNETSDICPKSSGNYPKNNVENNIVLNPNANSQNYYGINLHLDQVEDNYECETFFVKKGDKKYDNESSISDHQEISDTTIKIDYSHNNLITVDLETPKKNTNYSPPKINIKREETIDEFQFIAYYTKNDEINEKSSPESRKWSDGKSNLISPDKLFEKIYDYDNFVKDRNFLTRKKKKETDLKKHFENLIFNFKDSSFACSPIFSIIRELNGECYKITISYGKNKESKGVFLRLYKANSGSTHLAENFISFEKLKSLCTKIALYNSLAQNVSINFIDSIDIFIEKIFIYHCYILNKDGNITLGVLTRPLGICFNRAYEFTFLKISCIIDIFITQAKEVKFFIYNKNNEFMSLSFDWVLDSNCFNSLFIEYESKGFTLFEREVVISSYRTIDDIHLTKSGFITEIIINTQKILKHKIKDDNLTLETAVVIMKNGLYKTNIRDNFKFIDLWSIQFNEKNRVFEVEFYTLKKVQIKNEQIFVNLNKSIDFDEIHEVLGFDYKESYNLINEKDKLHLDYIILNSVNLCDRISQEIERKNVSTQLQIILEKPTSLFRFSFSTDLDGKNVNSAFGIFSLEYLYFKPQNHFYHLVYYDRHISKTYSKFLSVFHFTNLTGGFSPATISYSLPYTNENLSDNIKKEDLKKAIVKYFINWKKEDGYSVFDSFTNLQSYSKYSK